MKTNLGKEFFKILRKCFPEQNPLSKFLNKNAIKLSYSCMPSIGKVISGHNKQILKNEEIIPPAIVLLNNVLSMVPVKIEKLYINVKSKTLPVGLLKLMLVSLAILSRIGITSIPEVLGSWTITRIL